MEIKRQPNSTKQYQVFLCYANADREIAQKIVDALRNERVYVWFDVYELQPSDSIAEAIESAISASDYLIILLSPNSVNSVWVQRELAATLASDLATRDITLLPVLIEDCVIPPSLGYLQYLDLRTEFEQGVTLLVEQISLVPKMNFSKLDERTFEELVVELLDEIGFQNIEQEPIGGDLQIDARAEHSYLDPFGAKVTETWVIETKFYQNSRADLRALHQLAEYLSRLPAQSKGLLITNSQLTSVAKDWLRSEEDTGRTEIRVIDGPELKRLLLQHKSLIDKYFHQDTKSK